jgi:hypothetical protein
MVLCSTFLDGLGKATKEFQGSGHGFLVHAQV